MRIKDYWIQEVQQIKEFDALATTEDVEITKIHEQVSQLIDDQFIESASQEGIARREKMLKLIPFSDDTLESRRFKVLSRWNNNLPYTYNSLLQRLDQLCGADGYSVELNHEAYTLHIKVDLTVKRMEQEVDRMTRQMAPANLLVKVELRYRQHYELYKYTHEQLKAFTHKELREGALIL